jgi:hypothetical protein
VRWVFHAPTTGKELKNLTTNISDLQTFIAIGSGYQRSEGLTTI